MTITKGHVKRSEEDNRGWAAKNKLNGTTPRGSVTVIDPLGPMKRELACEEWFFSSRKCYSTREETEDEFPASFA